MTTDTTTASRTVRAAAWTGLALTAIVAAVPFLGQATQLLAEHIRSGYPGYTDAEIGAAVGAWQLVLTTLSGLGVLGWIWTIWSVRVARRWAPWSATALLTVAACLALALLTVRDTSGDVGLAPALGWIWAAPCLAGLVVTVAAWQHRTRRVQAFPSARSRASRDRSRNSGGKGGRPNSLRNGGGQAAQS